MREIKFRGKRLDNGEWVIGDLFQPRGGIKDIIAEGASGHIEKYPIAPATVGQFTGLLDSDNAEIYERDIVNSPRYNRPLAVRFVGGGFSVVNPNCCSKCANGEGAVEYLEEAIVLSDGQMKVIGNEIDTPELLNPKQS